MSVNLNNQDLEKMKKISVQYISIPQIFYNFGNYDIKI